MATSGITAYSVKTKTKNVPMVDPTIDVKSGRYIATGADAAGNKMAAIMSKLRLKVISQAALQKKVAAGKQL